jgi:cyclopropane-fatty-acyl-phospholipid synthase
MPDLSTVFCRALERIQYGTFHLITPDGREHHFAGPQPGAAAQLRLQSWQVVRNMLLRGDVALAEDYRDGLWESDDLEGLFLNALQNEKALDAFIYGGAFGRIAARLIHLFRRNTRRGSRRNIAAHYDLGNAFYSEWLDPTMTYSSALFQSEGEPLESAQRNKYQRILDQLGGAGEGRILEVGCGWGGFAETAAQQGYGVHGITLSQEQHAYAAERLQTFGDAAQVALTDYRDQGGRFDHLVSIEMFEAVGERYWPTYFRKVASLLHSKGRAVVQTITIAEPYFERYRRGGDAIRAFIFPGGMLPSVSRFEAEARQSGLEVITAHPFGRDYAETLRRWQAAFDARAEKLLQMGYDAKFQRLWRFYLACCAASFQVGRTDVYQFTLRQN